MLPPDPAEIERLAAVRAALPSLAAAIQLNTGSVGPLPIPVAEAMGAIEAFERDLGRAQSDYHQEALQWMDEARAAAASVVGGDLDEIALTHAATDGMNLGASSLEWRASDRVVTTSGEHSGGVGPLYALRDRLGVEVVHVEAGEGDPDRSDDDIQAALEAAMTPATRLVSVSHVLWTNGRVLPIARIAALAHDRGALVLVDGAQSAGAIPVAVRDLGADLYAVPAQKWLLGPEGMGFLWVAREIMARLRPAVGGHYGLAAWDSRGGVTLHPDARRFQASNYHRPSIVGMARAIGWLTISVGLPWVHERGTRLARAVADGLAAIPGVSLLTPRDRMATLVTFRVAGWTPDAALEALREHGPIVARVIASLGAIRVSIGAWTSEAECERLLAVVRLMAEAGPDGMPEPRRLPIFGQA